MQLLKKIAKLKIFPTKLMLVLTTLVLFGLISCTENSDKIVAESQEVKQIEIDDIDDESFKFNTSSLNLLPLAAGQHAIRVEQSGLSDWFIGGIVLAGSLDDFSILMERKR